MVANKCQMQSKPTQSQADIKQNRQTNAHTQTYTESNYNDTINRIGNLDTERKKENYMTL